MVRLIEVSRAIRESVPPELAPVFWAVTLFGSAEFILVVLSFAYWNVASRREEILRVVAMGFVALSATLALKYWFAASRPPAGVQNYPVTPDGLGFGFQIRIPAQGKKTSVSGSVVGLSLLSTVSQVPMSQSRTGSTALRGNGSGLGKATGSSFGSIRRSALCAR